MLEEIRHINITLNNLDIGKWIGSIADLQMKSAFGDFEGSDVVLNLSGIAKNLLLPVHIVSLSCLLKQLQNGGCIRVHVDGDEEMKSFLKDDLHLSEYFYASTYYVEEESDYNLNLWKISASHSLMYSQYVSDYLKRRYFESKDLSMLKVILDELYANVADHSQSEGVAYSFIHYDIEKDIIKIAFCDFGIGIKESLNRGGTSIGNEFIRFATQKGVTSRSNSHNRGFGLDTVISSVCNNGNSVRILSGNELLISYGNEINQKTWKLDFDFKGTLIYFDIPVSAFEDSDYLDCYEF